MTGQQTLEPPDVDTDPIEHLDEAWAIRCDYRIHLGGDACGALASWWLRCRSCGYTLAECARHRLEEAAALQSCDALHCTSCHASIPVPCWRDLFDVIPIGGTP